MHKIDVDALFEGKQSRYALVVGVAKRAREITEDFKEHETVTTEKPVLIAIEEIRSHEVSLMSEEDDL